MVIQTIINQQRLGGVAALESTDVEVIEAEVERVWGGRLPGARNYCRGTSNWVRDYIGSDGNPPTYPAEKFRRRFGIPRTLYKKIREDLLRHRTDFWGLRWIGGTRPGKPTDIKILAALRMLSTGTSSDDVDDVAYMSAETTRQYFRQFCEDVVSIYGHIYLKRWPTAQEMEHIQRRYEEKGFPGCVGALDCSKLFWKNCPVQDKGQYLNSKESGKLASIQCEAWCDADLYCWHWNVGRPGTNNDINVLLRSRLIKDIFSGRFNFKFPNPYRIIPSGQDRRQAYLLCDSIYPEWPLFSKPIQNTNVRKERKYSRIQEAARKDVERLFGVVQSRFEILRRELRKWELDDVVTIANACMILHNLIVRMQVNGDFRDEAGGSNLITEFYNTDVETAQQAAADYAEARNRIREEVVHDWHQQMVRMMINDVQFTSFNSFVELEDELIAHINDVFPD